MKHPFGCFFGGVYNPYKDARNKIIAHLDWDAYPNDYTYQGSCEEELETFLDNHQEYFNKVAHIVFSDAFQGYYALGPCKPRHDVYGLLTFFE